MTLVVTSAMPGCASTERADNREGQPATENVCFNVLDIRSFDALHDRFVYLRCLRGKHYLLTMRPACLGLQDSLAVTVASGFNRVCSHDRAQLSYRSFDRTARCRIILVEAVEDREAAVALVEGRTSPESTDKQPDPPPVS
jgi:hypothetical protein